MVLSELRYALRNLLKVPAFALTAILTLALGIGASTAVFTIVDSVILRPLSYRDSGRLVVLWEKVRFLANSSTPYIGPNPRHEAYWRNHNKAFQDICLFSTRTRGVSLGVDHPRFVGGIQAQTNFLNVLAVSPARGRNFVAGDAVKGHDTVAIITYSLWQSLFHGDPQVLGRTIHVGDLPYEVIGVLPKDFLFPKRNVLTSAVSKQGVATAPPLEIVTPAVINPDDFGWNSDYGNWIALARLKQGVSVRQAQAQLSILQQHIVDQMPADQRSKDPDSLLAFVQPLQDAMVEKSRRALWMLMAAVVGIMVIACVNLANAQLGRAILREREIGIRSALGAGTWQMLWNSLSESVLLAIAGGIGGIALAVGTLALFRNFSPIDLPRMSEIHLNYAVLGFALVLTIGSALFFGIAPALHLLRTDPQQTLQQNSGRTLGSRESQRFRLTLIGVQVFGCTALLLVTGLFAKSLASILSTERGFDTTNLMSAEVMLPKKQYAKDESRIVFDDGVLQRFRSLAGVESAALVSTMPLEGETWIDGIRRTDKYVDHQPLWNMRWVSAGYFEMMRERLVRGRFLEQRDRNTLNAVISEGSARAAWPDEDPIGHHFKWWDHVCTIVGVVADARINSLKDTPVNMVYLPYTANPPWSLVFMARTKQPPETIIPDIRRAIWNQDPETTIARVKTMEAQVKDSLAAERFQTFLLIGFGSVALLLAMLGVYGVLSYIVAGRTQEFGVRMALGASRERIYSLTMSQAAVPVLSGLLAGCVASAFAGALIEKLLYGVHPVDWSVMTTVVLLFTACAAIAAFLPARRAAAVDPMKALRAE
jgi:predicted permease